MRSTGNTRRRRRLRGLAVMAVLAGLFVAIMSGTALAAPPWSDAPNSWWVSSYGVTDTQAGTVADGYADGTFKPGLAVNRGQFAKMVVDGFGVATADPPIPTFLDVPRTHTFYRWIEGGVDQNLFSGYSDNSFRPGTNVTRQQANSILGAYLSQRELSATGRIQGTSGSFLSLNAWYTAEGQGVLAAFADRTSVAAAHAPGTAYLVYREVVQGSARPGGLYLSPGSSLTRSQAVAMILRVKGVALQTNPPTVTNLSPNSGPIAGGNSVTVTGANFVAGATVAFGPGNLATGVVVVNSTTIICIAPAHAAGKVDVTVTTSTGTSSTAGADNDYTYTSAPAITGLMPNGGPAAGGTTVTITGTGFTGATAVKFGAADATSFAVGSDTEIVAVAPAGMAGTTVDVTIVGPTGTSAPNEASKYSYGTPTVTGLNPAAGPAAGGNSVVISGTNFGAVTGPDAVKFGAANATSYVVNSDTQITAVAPPGTNGTTVDVIVMSLTGSSAPSYSSKYTYGVPTVTGLNPGGGPAGGGNTVIITGTGFTGLTGASAVKFGAVNATSYIIDGPTQIRAVAPAGADGSTVDVTVTSAAGTSATSAASKYVYGIPTVMLLNPVAGPAGGGNSVIITGTNFIGLTGASAVRFGNTNAVSYVVNSATQITAVAPGGANGSTVDVTVTNPAGISSTHAATKYSYGPPTVTGLSPGGGPASGGNSVIISGTGFTGLSGASAVRFGAVNASSYVVNSATQITAVAPPGTVGTIVDVVVTNPVGPSAVSADSKYAYVGTPTVTGVDPSTGPAAGGNTVIITGTNFAALSGPSAVKFGAVNATSYVVNSSTQITAVAPPGTAGSTVDVRVINPAGTSADTAADDYSYGVATITNLSPAAGPFGGGNTVIITGTNFIGVTGAAAVRFGSVNAASYVVNSATQITAVAPAGVLGTTVDVIVTNALGPSVPTANSRYSYGEPTITSLEPSGGPTSGGNSVVINGTGFTGVSGSVAVKFGLVNATGYVVNSDTRITAIAPAGTGTVDVSVTNPEGTNINTAADNYTYGIPTITNLNPAAGPADGDNSVVITGTGFTGTSAVTFGANPATSYVIDSATQITAIAPAGTAGTTVDVVVTNSAGSSLTAGTANDYSYGVPTVTGLSPSGGPASGGTSVEITGTGFTGLSGPGAVKFGAANASSYVVNSSTMITAVAPSGSGVVDVRVTNPAGMSADTGADDYTYGLPTVTNVSPKAGPAAGGNSVVITGTGFSGVTGAAGVKFGATNATSYVVDTGTQITAVAPAGTTGTHVDINVTNSSGTNGDTPADDYSYGPPVITSLVDAGGPPAGGNDVTINGDGFTGLSGASAVKFGAVNAASYVVTGPTQIQAVAPPGTAGTTVNVTVTNPAGTSSTAGTGNDYTYGAPTVTSLNPAAGAGGDLVIINGTNFSGLVGAAAVQFGGTNATSYIVNSNIQITAIAPAGAGTVDVTVTNPAGTSPITQGCKFTYGIPTVTGLSPDNGPGAGGTSVVITGTGFTGLSGPGAVMFGVNPATSYLVASDTMITAVAPAGTVGTTVDVRVTNPAGTSANTGADNYRYGVPTVTNLTPAAGATAGGTPVTITGTNFVAGATVAFGGSAATSVVVVNSTTITCVSPAGAGVVDVRVTTGAGQSATSPASKYSYGVPVVTLLNPNNGPAGGGNTVIITGSGFTGLSGPSAVTFGGTNASSYVVNSPQQITAVAPSGIPSTTVQVAVTNPAGTSANTAADDYTYNPPPP